jgi:hypothetical protein
MLRNRLYYALKPYIPWGWRIAARRTLCRHRRRTHRAVWPINPQAAQAPEGWTAWPDGKPFAILLTHDVEGPAGLAKCRQLAELEMSLGFRSCFNFVPEGTYSAPESLRRWLTDNGFEVGVHDLHHDGSLYRSHADFKAQAVRINHYLKEWNAVGFRAGFMFHNLEWLKALNIQYDASTFDTDPFEPQPDAAGTIHPFWVTRDDGTRYLELPYTLVQDSTLFLVLRERTPDIWLKKYDWVAANGGMVLINVHPDYLRFPGEAASPNTFTVDHYAALLRHAREQHGTDFWHGTPAALVAAKAHEAPAPAAKPRTEYPATNSISANAVA